MDKDREEEKPAGAAESGQSEADGHPRWRLTLYTMWVAQSFSIMGFSFVMPFMPFYVRELGVSEERMVAIWSGLLGTGAGLAMAVMGPIWGGVADRYGRKLMVVRAMLGGAVVLSVMGLVRNVRELFGLRMLQGGITGTVPASITLISSVVPRSRLGFSLGLMQMAVFSGASIGPYVGGIVADQYGYRVPFAVTGGLLFTGGLLVLVGVKERFVRPTPKEREAAAPVKEVLQTPGVMMLLLMYLLMNLSASFVMPIFPLFVEEIVGTPAQAAAETGLLLGIQGVVAALAAVMVGRLSDRVGHRRTLITCTVIAGVASFPHVVANSVLELALLRVVFGVAVGGMFPAMNAMVATIVPRPRLGQASGFTTTASALGWATGPLLGGLVAAAVGYRIPFVIMGVMLLLVGVAQQRGLRSREAEPSGGGAE